MEALLHAALQRLSQEDKLSFFLSYLKSEWITCIEDLQAASEHEKVWSALNLPLRLKLELLKGLNEQAMSPTKKTNEYCDHHDKGPVSILSVELDSVADVASTELSPGDADTSIETSEWVLCYSDEWEAYYYYHRVTGESVWASYEEEANEGELDNGRDYEYQHEFSAERDEEEALAAEHSTDYEAEGRVEFPVPACPTLPPAYLPPPPQRVFRQPKLAGAGSGATERPSSSRAGREQEAEKSKEEDQEDSEAEDYEATAPASVRYPRSAAATGPRPPSCLRTSPNMAASAPPLPSMYIFDELEGDCDKEVPSVEGEPQAEPPSRPPPSSPLFLRRPPILSPARPDQSREAEALLWLAMGQDGPGVEYSPAPLPRASEVRSFDSPPVSLLPLHSKPPPFLVKVGGGKTKRALLNLFGGGKKGRAPRAERVSSATRGPRDPKLFRLLELGFSEQDALVALQLSKGDVEEAATMLLEAQEPLTVSHS
eukprot:gene36341-44084_t